MNYVSYNKTDDSSFEFHTITISNICKSEEKGVHTTIDIVLLAKSGRHTLHVKVDSGAEANTIPMKIIRQMYPKDWKNVLHPTSTRLTPYNGT